MKRVRDSLGRPIRTGQQGGVVYGVLETLTAFGVLELTPRQYGAVVVFGTAALSGLQTFAENRLGWAFLRTVPRPAKRKRRERGDVSIAQAILCGLVVIVLLAAAGRF